MKQGVERPRAVIDLNFAPDLAAVAVLPSGALRIGGAATLSRVARRPDVQAGWPLLHEAILDGLTPQLRNAASVAGNVMQRPRCIYFREPGFACNKRVPGSGCAAQAGVHFGHAIFGGEAAQDCTAVHPSDLCVALTALDAVAQVAGPGGARTLPIAALHRLPGADPTRETTLRPGELITALDVPPQGECGGAYVKGVGGGFCPCLLRGAAGAGGGRGRLGARRARRRRAQALAVRACGGGPRRARAGAGHPPARDDAATAGAATDGQTAFRAALLRAVVGEALEQAVAQAAHAQAGHPA